MHSTSSGRALLTNDVSPQKCLPNLISGVFMVARPILAKEQMWGFIAPKVNFGFQSCACPGCSTIQASNWADIYSLWAAFIPTLKGLLTTTSHSWLEEGLHVYGSKNQGESVIGCHLSFVGAYQRCRSSDPFRFQKWQNYSQQILFHPISTLYIYKTISWLVEFP